MASDDQAAAMDSMYRVQRHFYDSTRRYYLLGRDRLVQDLRVPRGGTVLEIGCGTGRNLLKVAEAYPQAEVYGVDISQEMLKSARRSVARARTPRIHLAHADALSLDPLGVFGIAAFDRVFLSYTLSMIPDWQGALRRAHALLAPAGELHVADFGQCERLPGMARRLLFAWLRKFDVTPRHDLPAAAKTIAAAPGQDWAFDSSHRGYSWHLVLRRRGAEQERRNSNA